MPDITEVEKLRQQVSSLRGEIKAHEESYASVIKALRNMRDHNTKLQEDAAKLISSLEGELAAADRLIEEQDRQIAAARHDSPH